MRFESKTETEYAYKAGFFPDSASFSASSPSVASFHLQNEKGEIPDFLPVVTVSMTNYRYYSPDLGRWLSRDPIEENGGMNLYVACYNAQIDGYDYLGNIYIGTHNNNFAIENAFDPTKTQPLPPNWRPTPWRPSPGGGLGGKAPIIPLPNLGYVERCRDNAVKEHEDNIKDCEELFTDPCELKQCLIHMNHLLEGELWYCALSSFWGGAVVPPDPAFPIGKQPNHPIARAYLWVCKKVLDI